MNKFAAIILAAGKGKRINAKDFNKVILPLGNKPMISYTTDLLEALKVSPIIVVVGFAKKSVMDVLKDRVIFAEQKKRLGTAHAVLCGLSSNRLKSPASSHSENFVGSPRLINNVKDVLVMNGDDSAFYKKETIRRLIKIHQKQKPAITFLTIEVDNPTGLGRIVRDGNGRLLAVAEDKDTTEEIKKIKEINPAFYIFSLEFLQKFLKKIKKSKTTGEYYLTGLIDIAIKNNEKVETVKAGNLYWRGINTASELKEAERLFKLSLRES